MAIKKPLVIGPTGFPQQLQSGDQVQADYAVTDIRLLTNGEVSVSLTIGMAVYMTATNSSVKRAQANAVTTASVLGLVSDTSIAAAASGNVATGGVLTATTAQWDAVAGTTGGLTAGTLYYLDPVNPGKISSTVPTTAGQVICVVGQALNTTDMELIKGIPYLL